MNYEVEVTIRLVDRGQVLEEHGDRRTASTDREIERAGHQALVQTLSDLHAAARERADAAVRARSAAMVNGMAHFGGQ